MDQGDLVPDDVTIKCLQAEVDNPDSAGFLFDGFPRTLSQHLRCFASKSKEYYSHNCIRSR
jgi:adenylate kinase family enzyme